MKIAILGAGTVGAALTRIFCTNPRLRAIIVIDENGRALDELTEQCPSGTLRTYRVNINREHAITTLIKGFDVLICALPSHHNLRISEMALKSGIHYIDFGGSDEVLDQQLALNEKNERHDHWIIPNCGMAPGLVNILAMHGFESFEKVDSINIWASSLPVDPIPPFNIQLSFSPYGLLHEYLDPVTIIKKGELTTVEPLNGHETIKFDSQPDLGKMETFYISGGITSLAKQLKGKVNELTFRAIRYPGHRDLVEALRTLGFTSNQIIDIRGNLTYRQLLIRQLQKYLPSGHKDFVLIKIAIEGIKDGHAIHREYEIKHNYDDERDVSALMGCVSITTEIIAEMMVDKTLKGAGGVRPPEEIVPLDNFLDRLKEKGVNLEIHEHEIELSDA